MTSISSGGKAAFDQSQFSIQQSMEKEATGNLASLKVKVQDGKEVDMKKAVDIMANSFENLSPSQQKDGINVLKERLNYIKSHVDANQKGSEALLKTIEACEQKFAGLGGGAMGLGFLGGTGGTDFQNKMCKINMAAQVGVFGVASPQSNGDVLLHVNLNNAPSRFFTLKQNEHDKTITITELGNPGFSKTIPDDGNTLHALLSFKTEIGQEMIKAKEEAVKNTSDSVSKLAGEALKNIGESQATITPKKITTGSKIANFFKSIGNFFASIPKFFAKIFSSAKVESPSTHGTQTIDKSKVKLLAGKIKAEQQASKPEIKQEPTPSQVVQNSFKQEQFKDNFLAMNNWAGSSKVGFVTVNKQEGSNDLNVRIETLGGPNSFRDFKAKFDPDKQTLTITDPKDPSFKREMPCDGSIPAGFSDFKQEVADSINAKKELPKVDKGKDPVVDNFPLPTATPPTNVPNISSSAILSLPQVPDATKPPVLENNSLFPSMLQDIKVINASIGGSTGAKHVQAGGVDLIQKEGANGPHIVAEYNANKAYKALGVKVPEVSLYNKTTTAAVDGKTTSPAQPVMLAEFVKGAVPLGKYLQTANIDQKEEVLAKIRENFVADVLLANWDVVGMGLDNILVTADGTPVRIDNGASFEFRAQGGIKPGGGFSDKAGEITSMRDPSVNKQSAQIFGGITDKEIIWQINDVQSKFDSLLQATPQKYHATLKNRMADLQNYKQGLIQKQQIEHAKLQQNMMAPDQAVVFNKNFSADGLSLHGVPFKAITKLPDFALIPDKDVGEPPFVPHPTKETSAGVIVMEPDGKVWIYEPKNHFGGYEHTFPKGRMEKGLTMQQTAVKEAMEESGIHVQIEGFLMDAEKSTTKTRYYIARRVGGDPSQAHWEADKVKLVPGDKIMSYLNNAHDHPIGKKIQEYQKNNPMNLTPVPTTNPPKVDNFPLPKAEDVGKATQVQSQAILNPVQPLPKPQVLEAPSLFPTMFKDVKVINASIGGSTGAKLVQAGGTDFVQKTGNNAPHIVAEFNANKAYKALGVEVPEVKLYNMTTTQAVTDKEGSPGNPVMLAEFIKGAKPLGTYMAQGNVDQKEEVLAKMRENFIADVLLANWDVIGSSKQMDNILVTPDGTPVRIDNGACFEFRAQGEIKKGGFSNQATEIDTLRDSKLNPNSAAVYSGITDKEIIDQINDIAGKMDALLAATPTKYHDALKNRMAYLQDRKAQLIEKQAAEHKKLHQELATPEKSVVFNKNFFAEGLSLNGVPFKPVKDMPDFAKIPDVNVGEPPFVPQPGMKTSAGCIIMEPDGRVWIYEPKNHFGGYEHTFPKGTMEKGLTMQQTALKEAMEESGLQVKIEGFLMDQVKTTSKTRYYIARRVGGDPAQAHWEASNVKLATPEDLKKYLNTGLDKAIADKIADHQKTQPMKLPPVVTATPPQVDKMALPKPGDVATATPVSSQNIKDPVNPLPKPVLAPEGALFPAMFQDIKLLNASIGGSTGAKLVESGGQKFVQKEGTKEGHITAEYNANKAYKALGIKVPEVKLYNKVNSAAIGGEHGADAKPIMLASFVDNAVSLDKYLKSANPQQKEEMCKKIRANFVADALLANWDVIGLARDNILVTADGTPVRIDNGSAFEFRAQGDKKPGGFSDKATELDTMRDAKISPNGHEIYGGITNKEIVDQVNDLQSKFNDLLAATPAKYHDTLTKRMASLQEYKQNLISKDPSLATPQPAQGATGAQATGGVTPPTLSDSDKQLIAKFQSDFGVLDTWAIHPTYGSIQVEKNGNDLTLHTHLIVSGKWETQQFTASLDPSTKQITITSKQDPSDKTVMPYTDGIPAQFDAFRAKVAQKMQGAGLSADQQKMNQIKQEFFAVNYQAGNTVTGVAIVDVGSNNSEQKLNITAGKPPTTKQFTINYDLSAKKLVIASKTDPSQKKEISFNANVAQEFATFKKEVVDSINQAAVQGFDIKSHPQFVSGLKDTNAVSQHLGQAQFKQGDWVIRFSESVQKYYVCMKGPAKDGAALLQINVANLTKEGIEQTVASMKNEMQVTAPVVNKTFGTDQEIINSCFKSNLSFLDAKALLSAKPDGTYLMRQSTGFPEGKVLCFFDSGKQYNEILLKPKQPSGWSAEKQQPFYSSFVAGDFNSLEAVINSSALLKNNLKQPVAKLDSEVIGELNQGKVDNIVLLEAQLSSKPKGTYVMREGGTHPGSYVFVCSEGNGGIKNIGIRPDPDVAGGWIAYTGEPGKKFGSLSEVLNYSNFKDYLTTPQLPTKKPVGGTGIGVQYAFSPFKKVSGFASSPQPVSPSSAKTFNYKWGISKSPLPGAMQNTQIAMAKPEELLRMAANGYNVSGEQFLAAAEKHKTKIPSSGDQRGPELTTLHDLYCRAADKFEAAGNMKEAFEARAKAASFAGPAANSKLHNMSQAVTSGQQAQKSPLFPAHFSGLDTGILKGGSLKASNRTIDGNALTQLEFKLSKFARQDLQGHLVKIQGNMAAFEAALPPELKGKVRITEVDDTFLGKKSDGSFTVSDGYTPGSAKAIQIEFEGVGTVIIGNNDDIGCLYNNVKVLVQAGLPEGKAEQQVHQMLTMLGVGPIMNEQRPSDEERLKMALIFRNHFPKEAVKMERTKEFYELPLDVLKAKIEAAAPGMKDVFKKYEKSPHLIQKKDIYPGKTTFALTDISTQMRANGAYGLMAGVGDGKSSSEAADTVVLMMKNGALSSQDRFQAGLFAKGASSEQDLRTGGGDHVFTRLINSKTEKNDLGGKWGGDFPFSGKYQMLYDLDVCNTGAYGYNSDEYGVKNPEHHGYSDYEERKSLPELGGKISSASNEIMVKSTVPPDQIRGIVCQNQGDKDLLVQKLTAQGVIVNGKINGKPVDSFIHVANKFNKGMWDK